MDQNLTLKSFIEEATNESKRSTLRIRPLGVRGPPRSEVPFLVHTHHTINSTDIYTYNIHRYIYIYKSRLNINNVANNDNAAYERKYICDYGWLDIGDNYDYKMV